MGCESFDVVRLHLGPLLQGQIRVAKLKSAFSLLINEKCCLSSKLCQLAVVGGYIQLVLRSNVNMETRSRKQKFGGNRIRSN